MKENSLARYTQNTKDLLTDHYKNGLSFLIGNDN